MMDNKSRIHYLLVIPAGLAIARIAAALGSAWTRLRDIDFQTFYESAAALRAGSDPYLTSLKYTNLNPPHFIVAFTPFTWFEPHTALALWLTVNLVCLAAATMLIWRELRLPQTVTAFMIGIVAAGLTTALPLGIEEAHPIGFLTLCVTAAWKALRHGRWKIAGILIGTVVSLKPFFGCLLLVVMARRHWKCLVWSCGAALSALALGMIVAGPHSFLRWIEVGSQVSWFQHPLNASLLGLTSRGGLSRFVWVVSVAVTLALTAAAIRPVKDLDAEWAACGLLSILISPLGWIYYLPPLAGPLAAVALRRPAALLPLMGLVWPVPELIALAPITRWTAVSLLSLPFWAVVGTWMAVVYPLTVDGDQDNSRRELIHAPEAVS